MNDDDGPEPMPFEPDDEGPCPVGLGRFGREQDEELADALAAALFALALCDQHEAKRRKVAELVSQWNDAARAAARDAMTIRPGESTQEWAFRGARAAATSSAYELCGAQLAACLARPARPNADDSETDGEE